MPLSHLFRRKKTNNSQEGDQPESTEQLFFTTEDYGLETLAEGAHDTVDIVFVHGLTGNRETTWSYDKTLWPRDLLAKELHNVRIFTFGYDADVIGFLNMAGSNCVRDHGKSLAQDLAGRRITTDSRDRPLIFVAHSLGGLVVEQALLIARGSSQPHVKALLPSTIAIAFMGTPHLGSRKADWAGPLTQMSNLLRKTNKEIVAVLRPGSEMLGNLQEEFHTMLEDRRKNEGLWIDIFCFYEEIPYLGIGKIVSRQSAILTGYPNASIHQNHSNMTKFSGNMDAGYVRVRDQLWIWVDAANKKKPEVEAQLAQTQAHALAEHPPQPDSVDRNLNRSEDMEIVPLETPAQAQGSMQTVPEPDRAAECPNRDRKKSEGAQQNRQNERAAVSSGGGAIFMGNVSAGRDFTYNHN
jgi:pimeloyl-ACP methyl ester carboxylesterase